MNTTAKAKQELHEISLYLPDYLYRKLLQFIENEPFHTSIHNMQEVLHFFNLHYDHQKETLKKFDEV